MRHFCRSLILAIALSVAHPAAAGREEPIRNPTYIPIAWAKARPPTIDEIGRAIVTGCSNGGWLCGVTKPGEIRAFRYVGRHMAECRIDFDTSTFTFTYVDSSTLLFDAKAKTIHRNYNLWVADLINYIHAAIAFIPQ